MLALLLLALLPSSFAAENVIFITLDGVRFQDFFKGVRQPRRAGYPMGTTAFPILMNSVKEGEGWLYGDHRRGERFFIGDEVALSLPGYRSLLSGEFEDRCESNHCENIDRETLFDTLSVQGLYREEMAAFASWEMIDFALESTPGKIFKNVAFQDYPSDFFTENDDVFIRKMIEKSRTDLPKWSGSRRDIYTYALGKNYLERHHPRFLYLSFVDSDEYGHRNDYRAYISSLMQYDRWIAELRTSLKSMGDYGENTSIVITTDHGRFRGPLWGQHGRGFDSVSSAYRTWAVVLPSEKARRERRFRKRKSHRYDQLDVRPTLEMLMGVASPGSRLRTGTSLLEETIPSQP